MSLVHRQLDAAKLDRIVSSFVDRASRLPRRHLLEPFADEAVRTAIDCFTTRAHVYKQLEQLNLTDMLKIDVDAYVASIPAATGKVPEAERLEVAEQPLSEAEPDMYPCLLAVFGAHFDYIKINSDGSYSVVDSSARGGTALLGIASLLTGCKTFAELTEVAERGNCRALDQYTSDIASAPGDDDQGAYAVIARNLQQARDRLFCFGHAVATQLCEFKREDVAQAWLNYVVIDLVQSAQHLSSIHAVQRVFFCGQYCTRPLVRSLVTAEYARRNLHCMLHGKGTYDPVAAFDIVKTDVLNA